MGTQNNNKIYLQYMTIYMSFEATLQLTYMQLFSKNTFIVLLFVILMLDSPDPHSFS